MNNAILTASAGSYAIYGIIRKTLSYLDPRLVQHGDRVAYIAD